METAANAKTTYSSKVSLFKTTVCGQSFKKKKCKRRAQQYTKVRYLDMEGLCTIALHTHKHAHMRADGTAVIFARWHCNALRIDIILYDHGALNM